MTRRIKHRSPPDWLRTGVLVDYCSVIGEPPTQQGLTVRTDPAQLDSGHWVVWLNGKAGCVHVDAVLPAGSTCPKCASPKPHLHPAVQSGGECHICDHAFHRRVTPENTPDRIRKLGLVPDSDAP